MAKITIDMESIIIDDYGEDLQELIKRETLQAVKSEVRNQVARFTQELVREVLGKYRPVMVESIEEARGRLEKEWMRK
jgi:hypothetical protein